MVGRIRHAGLPAGQMSLCTLPVSGSATGSTELAEVLALLPDRSRVTLIFCESLFLSYRGWRGGADILGAMGEVKGFRADLRFSLFLEAGSQALDIVVDNRRLNENE